MSAAIAVSGEGKVDARSGDVYDVAIIGAGPYGLAAAAHLRAANGLRIVGFGEPMSF